MRRLCYKLDSSGEVSSIASQHLEPSASSGERVALVVYAMGLKHWRIGSEATGRSALTGTKASRDSTSP
jgi:hypothetical protein